MQLDLLKAELQRCQAEFDSVNSRLKQLVATADSDNLDELKRAIRAALKQLKNAADQLQEATAALDNYRTTRIQ